MPTQLCPDAHGLATCNKLPSALFYHSFPVATVVSLQLKEPATNSSAAACLGS